MYGTLRAHKCKQSPDEYQQFKNYYCGLCDALGKDFGNLGRLTVNYDITFFYLLLDSLVEESYTGQGNCPTTPWKKRSITVNEKLHPFMGAVNIYLAGLKLEDDLFDEGSLSKKIGYRTMRSRIEKATEQLKEMGVDTYRTNQLFLEQLAREEAGETLEDYYQVTAKGLAFLLAEGSRLLGLSSAQQEILIQLGQELGKIIYLMDSYVDYPSDTKNERFNALAQAFGDRIKLKADLSSEIREEIYTILTNSLSHANALIEALEIKKNRSVIQHVLQELGFKIEVLVKNTSSMEEVQKINEGASPLYLLTHPGHFFKSRAAHRRYVSHHRRSSCCCCGPDCDDLVTTAICCDAADCDCDALECLSTGNPCELAECFC